jgi:hypothetical protein
MVLRRTPRERRVEEFPTEWTLCTGYAQDGDWQSEGPRQEGRTPDSWNEEKRRPALRFTGRV